MTNASKNGRDPFVQEQPERWKSVMEELEWVIADCEKARQDPASSPTLKSGMTSDWIDKRFERLLAWYSGGRPVAGLAPEAVEILCREWPAYVAAFPPGKSEGAAEWPGPSKMLRWASLLVLARPPAEAARAFGAVQDRFIADAGKPRDRIVEAMLAHLEPGKRRIATETVCWPDAYEALWQAIDPDNKQTDRPAQMKAFLNGWYGKMKNEAAAQSGRLEAGSTAYVGYWCLEAAAGAVVAGIDDSSFRNHPHYPADWADWARRTTQASG